MSPSTTGPTTLLGLLNSVPAERTAVIVPEQNIRISYGELRRQVEAFAEALACGFERFVTFLGASKLEARAIREPLLRRRVSAAKA